MADPSDSPDEIQPPSESSAGSPPSEGPLELPESPSQSVPEPAVKISSELSLDSSNEEISLLYELLGDRDRLTTIILVGASAMIPVPFLDDWAKSFLERRSFRLGAERENFKLSSEEADRLVQEPPSGCCWVGCLGKALIYPIKKLIRKILFFLEIKRAVDQSTNALAENWLLSLALRRGIWKPGGDLSQTDLLREVIEKTCTAQGVKPLELAFQGAFQGAKGTLFDFANRFIGKTDQSKEELSATVDQFKKDEADQIAKMTQKLRTEVSAISDSYLRRFAQGFEKELRIAMDTPRDPGLA